jgi:hypothetical protein
LLGVKELHLWLEVQEHVIWLNVKVKVPNTVQLFDFVNKLDAKFHQVNLLQKFIVEFIDLS